MCEQVAFVHDNDVRHKLFPKKADELLVHIRHADGSVHHQHGDVGTV